MNLFKKNRYSIFIILSIFFVSLFFLNPFKTLDNKINDLIVSVNGERSPDNRIIIVEIDDASIKALEKKWPWKRALFADGIANIAAQNPKIIGLDFIFSDPGDSKDDAYFEEKLTEISSRIPIISASNFTLKKESASINQQKMLIFEENLEETFFKFPAGFVNVQLDSDQMIRRVQLYKEYKNQKYYFFSLVLASFLEGFKLSDVSIDGKWAKIPNKEPILLDFNQSVLVNYAGISGTYKKISFFQVSKNLLPENFFKDKIVLIGPTLTLANDFHMTPFSDYLSIQSKMSGIEILANILENILNQKFYSPMASWVQLVSLFFILAFFFFFLYRPQTLIHFVFILSGGVFLYIVFIFSNFLLLGKLGFNMVPILCMAAFSVFIIILTFKKTLLNSIEIKNKVQLNDEFIKKYSISQREREIVMLIIDGLDNNQISKKLFISLSTVKKHIYSIFQKAGINKREELVQLIGQFSKES